MSETKKEFKFETSITCEDLPGIFDAFIQAFKEERIDLRNNDYCFTLLPPKHVKVAITAEQECKDECDNATEEASINIQISWKKNI